MRTCTVVSPEVAELARLTVPTFPSDTFIFDYNELYMHPKYMFFALKSIPGPVRYVDCDVFMRTHHWPYQNGTYMFDEAAWRKDANWADQFRDETVQRYGPVDWTEHWWNPGVSMIEDTSWLEMPKELDYWVTKASKGKPVVKNMPWLNWLIAKNKIDVKGIHPHWDCMSPLTSRWAWNAKYWHLTQNEYYTTEDKIKLLKQTIAKYGEWKPKVALVTVVIGKQFEEMFEITGDRMAEKAKEWGMDLIVRRNRGDWPSPAFAKCTYPEDYDAMLYLDCDTLIASSAPNPMSLAPCGTFAALDSMELPYRLNGCMATMHKYARRHGKLFDESFYLNTGVFICWKEAKHILDVIPMEYDRYYEQNGVNFNMIGNEHLLHRLPPEWNFGHLHREGRSVDRQYIVHLNGVRPEKRMETLRCLISRGF